MALDWGLIWPTVTFSWIVERLAGNCWPFAFWIPEKVAMAQRIAMGVEYDGSRFFGWQTQAQEPTVQACLEQALSRVADEPLVIKGAGRTDTGVHASGQVFHFDCTVHRPARSWILGANAHLPADISVLWCRAVSDEFDSRFSAISRRYRYRILNRWVRPAMARTRMTWVRRPLDAARMHEAGQVLLGEHDFTSLRSMRCHARHAIRRMTELDVSRRGDQVIIDVQANAFLHHMVRNIAGTLIEVGAGKRDKAWLEGVLASRDRAVAGITAAPHGLCLQAVYYPLHFEIPDRPDRPEDLR